jgi:hypothetical protein
VPLARVYPHVTADQDFELHDFADQSLADQDFALHWASLQFAELHESPVHELSDQLAESHSIPDHDLADHESSLQDLASHWEPIQASVDHDFDVQGVPYAVTSPVSRPTTPSLSASAYTWSVPREASSEPVPLEATSPRLAEVRRPRRSVTAFTAEFAFTSPAPEPVWFGSLVAVRIRMALIWFGVRSGLVWVMSATTPDTIAVAWEVPLPLK